MFVSDEEAGGKDFSLLQPILPEEHNMKIAWDLRSRNQQDDRYYCEFHRNSPHLNPHYNAECVHFNYYFCATVFFLPF